MPRTDRLSSTLIPSHRSVQAQSALEVDVSGWRCHEAAAGSVDKNPLDLLAGHGSGPLPANSSACSGTGWMALCPAVRIP